MQRHFYLQFSEFLLISYVNSAFRRTLPSAEHLREEADGELLIGEAVDEDVNIYDSVDVEWAITTRFNAKKGFMILKDQPGHILNPMVAGGLVTQAGVDATAPFPRTSAFEHVQFKDINLRGYVIE